MTVRDTQAHLQEIYGVEVSPELISKVTDAVLPELRAWQQRPIGTCPQSGDAEAEPDPPMPHQSPIDRGPARHRIHPLLAKVIPDSAQTPPRVHPAHLHHPLLHLSRHLMRTRPRPRTLIRQPTKPIHRIPPQQRVHRLTGHPIPTSRRHRGPIQHLRHRFEPLLHQSQLREHDHSPPPSTTTSPNRRRTGLRQPRDFARCHPGAGTTVAQLPDPRPQSVTHLPEPQFQVSTGTAQSDCGAGAGLTEEHDDAARRNSPGLRRLLEPAEQVWGVLRERGQRRSESRQRSGTPTGTASYRWALTDSNRRPLPCKGRTVPSCAGLLPGGLQHPAGRTGILVSAELSRYQWL